MPLAIPNTSLPDQYSDAATFAGTDVFAWGFFTVANNSAFVQMFEGISGQATPQPEVFCPPATYPIAGGSGGRPISGIRARNAVAGDVAQFFGSMFYPQEPGIQAGTPFTSLVSPSGVVGAGVGVLDRSTSVVDNTGVAVETTMYGFNVDGGVMGVSSMLRLTILGDLLRNNAAANTLTLRVKFGGVTHYAAAMYSGVGIAANYVPAITQLWIANLGALNSQMIQLVHHTHQPSGPGPTTGIGQAGGDNQAYRAGTGGQGTAAAGSTPATVDTSVTQTLQVTAQWSAAAATNSYRKRYALLELL